MRSALYRRFRDVFRRFPVMPFVLFVKRVGCSRLLFSTPFNLVLASLVIFTYCGACCIFGFLFDSRCFIINFVLS